MNELKQAPWQERYESTYLKLLKKYSIPFDLIDSTSDRVLNSEDYLWVMHYEDLLSQVVKTNPKRTIFRISGTSIHPYCYQVDAEDESWVFENIGFNLSFHPRMTRLLRQFFPNSNFVDTGYPIDVPEPDNFVTRVQRTIVVGGRLSADKQFMLSTFLLQPYVDEGYEVTFCYPNRSGNDDLWMDKYGGYGRYKRRGFKFEEMSNEQWLKKLQKSEFYFTASLGDTACCSCVEAVRMGTYPLVPKIDRGLPAYDTYIDVGYEPFSALSLKNLIRTKPKITVDDTWINPDFFMQRFISQVLTK